MKKILKTLLFLAVVGAIGYQFRSAYFPRLLPILDRIRDNFTLLFLTPAPCAEPIPYTLGTFDVKFNISQKYFLSALADAEAVWEKPFGKELFKYTADQDAKADRVMKINLVYDYRQQATSKLASLGISVENNRASYDELKAKLTALKAEYQKEKKVFDERVKNFDHTEAQAKELKAMQADINNMVDEINALVVALNRLVDSLNLSVEKYNTTNSSRGESFEEGVYSSNGLQREIDIYEFSSRAKLVRVLAHELGHALDLDHVDDTKAIMYKLNQGNSQALTTFDISALKVKCGIK